MHPNQKTSCCQDSGSPGVLPPFQVRRSHGTVCCQGNHCRWELNLGKPLKCLSPCLGRHTNGGRGKGHMQRRICPSTRKPHFAMDTAKPHRTPKVSVLFCFLFVLLLLFCEHRPKSTPQLALFSHSSGKLSSGSVTACLVQRLSGSQDRLTRLLRL